jgi:K+-transporting ATPase A subunit
MDADIGVIDPTSQASNNGSAFTGISVNTPLWNTALGLLA